jgi:hypothetical protein
MNVRVWEVAIVAHVLVDRNALARWSTLRLSPECAAVLDAVFAWPERPAGVALALNHLIGDVDPVLHDAADALARDVDAMTFAEYVTLGSLETVVRCLHAERLQLGRAA